MSHHKAPFSFLDSTLLQNSTLLLPVIICAVFQMTEACKAAAKFSMTVSSRDLQLILHVEYLGIITLTVDKMGLTHIMIICHLIILQWRGFLFIR